MSDTEPTPPYVDEKGHYVRHPLDTSGPAASPNHPGAHDTCGTCGHARWRHRWDGTIGDTVCTEYANCVCHGRFTEREPGSAPPRRLRGLRVYLDTRDRWIGHYLGERHHYVCPLPTVVIRWDRRSR